MSAGSDRTKHHELGSVLWSDARECATIATTTTDNNNTDHDHHHHHHRRRHHHTPARPQPTHTHPRTQSMPVLLASCGEAPEIRENVYLACQKVPRT